MLRNSIGYFFIYIFSYFTVGLVVFVVLAFLILFFINLFKLFFNRKTRNSRFFYVGEVLRIFLWFVVLSLLFILVVFPLFIWLFFWLLGRVLFTAELAQGKKLIWFVVLLVSKGSVYYLSCTLVMVVY